MDADLGPDPATELGTHTSQTMRDVVQLLWLLEQEQMRQSLTVREAAEEMEARADRQAQRMRPDQQPRGDGERPAPWTKEDLADAWGTAVMRGDEPMADRVEAQMRRQAPESMSRYDAARQGGASRVDAMRDCAKGLDEELGRYHQAHGAHQRGRDGREQESGRTASRADSGSRANPGPRRPENGRDAAARTARSSRPQQRRTRPGPGRKGSGPDPAAPSTWSKGNGRLVPANGRQQRTGSTAEPHRPNQPSAQQGRSGPQPGRTGPVR
jgi:hypothetical protein